jgi:two-component system, OmpR family, sensor histidine kinase KdpD
MSAMRSLSEYARRLAQRASLGAQSLRRDAAHLGARGTDLRAVVSSAVSSAVPLPRWMVSGRGYVAAGAGVAAVSIVIGLVLTWVHISNISLLYLLPVLWLAAVYGRGAAIFASALSFLAYDFFFIPPFHLFTVDDPTEWLSLFALLATALVLGQLTAAVQARAREALESRQRIATLYGLAQLIVTTTEQEHLNTALAQRVAEVFAPQGMRACSLILRDQPAGVRSHAVAPADTGYAGALSLTLRDNAGSAQWAFERGQTVGGARSMGQDAQEGQNGHSGQEGLAGHTGHTGHTGPHDARVYFVPLRSGRRVVGVLGVSGTDEIRSLIQPAPEPEQARLPSGHGARVGAGHEEQLTLFAAFCDQIALALDRSALQQQAIHAEALRESDQLKDVLLGSVTHDLRTPLASIKAAVSSLLQPDMTWSDEERRDFLTSIDASTDRLNRLVGNLLDLSRLEAGSAPPEKDWYLIGEVVATVLDRLDLTGQTRQHRIVVDIPRDVPLVPMDYGQIEEVLTNLLENALKYSPAGSEIRIVARARPSAELEVRVQDQGIGIPPNELGAIFDKFYRVQHVQLPWATTRPPVGTGLGLAICAAIIRTHDGHIWAESTPGHGATFIFTLPIPQDRPQGALPELDAPDAVDPDQSAAAAREVQV